MVLLILTVIHKLHTCMCVQDVCVVAYLNVHTQYPINPRFMVMVGAKKKKKGIFFS